AEEAIPIWDSKRQRELVAFIRFYYIEDIDGNKIKRVEYYTENDVTYFIERGNSFIQEFLYDEYGKMTDIQEGHFRINNKEQGWGKVPFIPFKNNEKCVSDLNFYKSLIDIYDNNISTLADNLDEIQEVIYVLKEYPGTSLQEFIDNIRYYKSIKVDGGGGVDKLEINIPVEAKKELLDRLEKNIIIFGQGVNPESQ
ncbi:phage portal protein, partial [Clostridioides difficile]|nr:phage portal protein [Clostridioides difficile]